MKKGMTSMFVGKKRVACTVLQFDQVQVVANKTREKNGYWAVQIGMGSKDGRNVTQPQLGYYEAKGVAPKRELSEFKVRDESGLLPVGVQLQPDWFQLGQYVDVRGRSRGMGFAGGMKRHGFAGQEASHGNSKNHRTIGTTGPSQGSGSRVFPGKKMPGRMGNEYRTVQNLKIMKVDNELGIVLVSGPVAGPKGRVVQLQDSKKRKAPALPYREKAREALNERFPDAQARLQEAREKHMEMKTERRAHMQLD
jgi:large subunit ribosomal protein L3